MNVDPDQVISDFLRTTSKIEHAEAEVARLKSINHPDAEWKQTLLEIILAYNRNIASLISKYRERVKEENKYNQENFE